MDGRGGCCTSRYGVTNGGGAYYDPSKVDRIMLRFRPIAPKPSPGGSPSAGSSPESRDSYVKTGRGRRRYARQSSYKGGGGGNRKRCGRKQRPQPAGSPGSVIKKDAALPGDHREVVTLPLLRETPELISRPEIKDARRNDNVIAARAPSGYRARSTTTALGAGEVCYFQEQQPRGEEPVHATWLNLGAVQQPIVTKLQVEAWVTVECVMDTWLDRYALGRTDEERRRCLREDAACPGFMSDRLGKVTWTNAAFRQTVIGDAPGNNNVSVPVWLAMKDAHPSVPVTVPLLALPAAAFTCRVRMQYASWEENNIKGSSMTVPCDVWRMDDGGFAWRLDVKAALSLGR